MGRSVKHQIPSLLAGIDEVTPAVFDQLLTRTGSSASYLRKLLREQTVPLHPLVEGVRQDSPGHLIRTLTSLAGLYPQASSEARAVVLESKRHTQILLARDLRDPWRNLVLLHLNTWLENPTVYPIWSQLQMRNAASSGEPAAF